MTEAEEFYEIYKLDVVELPTNRPMIRKDFTQIKAIGERIRFVIGTRF